jgi:uncharacterized protein
METDRNGMAVLSTAECLQRLGRAGIGRVAVSIGALPAVFPVNYAVDDGDIYFRTATGTKLTAASRNAVVAFEVDHADRLEHDGWSVLVVGPAAEVTDPAELKRLSALPLRRWIAGGPDTLVRIRAEHVSGREIAHLCSGPTPAQTCPSCR